MIRPFVLVRMLLPAVFVTVLLAGCGIQQTEASGGAVVKLQERVRTARQLVSEQNPSAALNEIEALASDLATAAANGDLPAEQHQRAETALGAVRTDLESLVKEAAATDGSITDEPLSPAETPSDAGNSDDRADDRQWDRDGDREDTEDEDSWEDQDSGDDQDSWKDEDSGDEDSGDDD
jgi:hypothetical protein